MSKLHAFLMFGALAAVCLLSLPMSSRAQSMSCASVNGSTLCMEGGAVACQTVNGRTVCKGSDNLECHVAGGRMVCAHGPDTSCETVDSRTLCRTRRTTEPPARPRASDDNPAADMAGAPLPPDASDTVQSIRLGRHGHELHIRNGHVDITIE